jgi:hypothetical protein
MQLEISETETQRVSSSSPLTVVLWLGGIWNNLLAGRDSQDVT